MEAGGSGRVSESVSVRDAHFASLLKSAPSLLFLLRRLPSLRCFVCALLPPSSSPRRTRERTGEGPGARRGRVAVGLWRSKFDLICIQNPPPFPPYNPSHGKIFRKFTSRIKYSRDPHTSHACTTGTSPHIYIRPRPLPHLLLFLGREKGRWGEGEKTGSRRGEKRDSPRNRSARKGKLVCGGEGRRFFRRRLKEVNGEQKMGKGGKRGGDDGRTIANSQASF